MSDKYGAATCERSQVRERRVCCKQGAETGTGRDVKGRGRAADEKEQE